MSRQEEEARLLSSAGEPQSDRPPSPPISSSPSSSSNNNAVPINVNGAGEEEEDEEESLEDYASMVVTILQPVAITMVLVVWAVKTINVNDLGDQSAAMIYHESSTDSAGKKFAGSILNALIFLCIIIGTTVVFVFLYKYRCLKIIYGWLMLSTCSLLAAFGGYIFYLILQAENLPLDYLSFSLFIWNFAVVGIIAIFWHSPTKINQAYLILISALLAIYFTRLPEWTTWAILAAVAIYDLFAVLCPKGPLKVLVETAQQRQEPIPALLYNASVVMMAASDDEAETQQQPPRRTQQQQQLQQQQHVVHHTIDDEDDGPPQGAVLRNTQHQQQQQQQQQQQAQPEETPGKPEGKGVKLGLGDFVFYSVLMGRAALFDIITVFTCFIGIITGLFGTLLLLAVFRKALPALPISIFFGIVFYFLTRGLLFPFVASIGVDQVFV